MQNIQALLQSDTGGRKQQSGVHIGGIIFLSASSLSNFHTNAFNGEYYICYL